MEPSNQPTGVKKSLSPTLVVIIVLVLVALALVVVYLYSQGGLGKDSKQTRTTIQTGSIDKLSSDLDALNAGDVSSDFSEVDRDLQGLK